MLYEHQKSGVQWLANRNRAMLLDEQGLGKTITAITAAASLDCSGPILVLCPSVVLWNWQREWKTWDNRSCVQIIATGKDQIDTTADVVITTHSLLLTPALRKQIVLTAWELVILDEAHMFRTPTAKRTKAFYFAGHSVVASSNRVWCLTGTPMPNNVSELWTHIRGLAPERLVEKDGALDFFRFRRRFCVLKETRWGVKIIGNRNVSELKRRMEGLTLRRMKKDVLDLPDIRFKQIMLRPSVLPAKLLKLSDAVTTSMNATQGLAAIKNSEEFARWRRMSGIAKVEPAADLLTMELEDRAIEKIVVFAHHKDVIEGLHDRLSLFGAVVISGSTTTRNRDAAVHAFQNDPCCRVIICNIVAGGTGVTLTAASEVAFVELSPVPGENAQAADRCHRIGQSDKVRVRFVALAGTVDENITEILKNKTRMIREVLS